VGEGKEGKTKGRIGSGREGVDVKERNMGGGKVRLEGGERGRAGGELLEGVERVEGGERAGEESGVKTGTIR